MQNCCLLVISLSKLSTYLSVLLITLIGHPRTTSTPREQAAKCQEFLQRKKSPTAGSLPSHT
jgi:hypothetical protein